MMLRAERAARWTGRSRNSSRSNDIVVTKSGYARLLRVRTYVNDDHLATHRADGLIVAHADRLDRVLAVGGRADRAPVRPRDRRDADLRAHAERARGRDARPTTSSRCGSIPVGAPPPPPILTVDGQEGFPLADDDEVRVEAVARTGRA